MTLEDRNNAIGRHPEHEKDYMAYHLALSEDQKLACRYRRLISKKWKIEELAVDSFEPSYWHPRYCGIPKKNPITIDGWPLSTKEAKTAIKIFKETIH